MLGSALTAGDNDDIRLQLESRESELRSQIDWMEQDLELVKEELDEVLGQLEELEDY